MRLDHGCYLKQTHVVSINAQNNYSRDVTIYEKEHSWQERIYMSFLFHSADLKRPLSVIFSLYLLYPVWFHQFDEFVWKYMQRISVAPLHDVRLSTF